MVKSRNQTARPTMVMLLVLAVCASIPAWAEDNTVTTINGVTSNANGVFILGNTGTNNFLSITNNGVLIDTTGTIGNASTANFNNAVITGTGSVWTNSGLFTMGNSGSGNTLVITNGGKLVSNGSSEPVGNTVSSSNNSITITGTGSVWTNPSGWFYLGNCGAGNRLPLDDRR